MAQWFSRSTRGCPEVVQPTGDAWVSQQDAAERGEGGRREGGGRRAGGRGTAVARHRKEARGGCEELPAGPDRLQDAHARPCLRKPGAEPGRPAGRDPARVVRVRDGAGRQGGTRLGWCGCGTGPAVMARRGAGGLQ